MKTARFGISIGTSVGAGTAVGAAVGGTAVGAAATGAFVGGWAGACVGAGVGDAHAANTIMSSKEIPTRYFFDIFFLLEWLGQLPDEDCR